jgi:hypothetical protein
LITHASPHCILAHFSIISEEKEVAIGKQYAAEIDRTAVVYAAG